MSDTDSEIRNKFDRRGFRATPDFVYRSETEELYTAVYTNDKTRELVLKRYEIPIYLLFKEKVALHKLSQADELIGKFNEFISKII